MWRLALAIVGALVVPENLRSQVERLNIARSCSYTRDLPSSEIYTFASDDEARNAVARIMEYTGLPQNFEIRSATTPNAAAVIVGQRRLILYNQQFIDGITAATTSDWAALSILAHEIGHHLAGHTLQEGGSRPAMELEADRFSGFVLAKMGAKQEQAQSAMAKLASKDGSATHPPQAARIDAIYNGWRAATSVLGKTSGEEPVTVEKPAKPPIEDQPAPVAQLLTGTWEGKGARYYITQNGSEVQLQEMMGGMVTATGSGNILNREVALNVWLATFEPVTVRLVLSTDGRRLDGTITNILGMVTPIQLRRLAN